MSDRVDPAMPASVDGTVTLRGGEPVLRVTFTDLVGEQIELDLGEWVAADLLHLLSAFNRQLRRT